MTKKYVNAFNSQRMIPCKYSNVKNLDSSNACYVNPSLHGHHLKLRCTVQCKIENVLENEKTFFFSNCGSLRYF